MEIRDGQAAMTDAEKEKAIVPTREIGTQRDGGARARLFLEDDDKVIDLAMICHEANRAYCVALGDFTQFHWSNAPAWQQVSAEKGVRAHLTALAEGRDMTPRQSHESWLAEKEREGWQYGTVKDTAVKTHPCFRPFDELPDDQKRKDALFGAVVRALAGPL